MRIPLLAAALLAMPALAAPPADSAVGRWQTIDDATGKPKSVVEIHAARDGTLSGTVVEILDLGDGPDPRCDKCEGALRGRPIKGMVILWGLRPQGTGRWSAGRVLDPEKGRTYAAKLEVLDGGRRLGVSGCIAFVCRQQAWQRR